MATDFLGNEIQPGSYVIWKQVNKLIPLYMQRNNLLLGITDIYTVTSTLARADSDYIVISQDVMSNLLRQRPLLENLFFGNRTRRPRTSIENARIQKAERYLTAFLPGGTHYLPIPSNHIIVNNNIRQSILSESAVIIDSLPPLPLPIGTAISVTNIDGEKEELQLIEVQTKSKDKQPPKTRQQAPIDLDFD